MNKPDFTIKNVILLLFGLDEHTVFTCKNCSVGLVVESSLYFIFVKLVYWFLFLAIVLLPCGLIITQLHGELSKTLVLTIAIVYVIVSSFALSICAGMFFLKHGHWKEP